MDDADVELELLPPWWVAFTIGVLALVAGVVVLLKPDDSLNTLAVITGIFILVDGIFALVAAALSKGSEGRGAVAVLGALSAIAGILLIRHPGGGVTFVALVLAIWLVAAGAVRLFLAFADPYHRGRGILAASALILAGLFIAASPHIRYATLALFTGLGFILYGVAMVVVGLAIRQTR